MSAVFNIKTLIFILIRLFLFLRLFFTARVYAKLLHNDPYGRISIMQFFNYVMRKGERYNQVCVRSGHTHMKVVGVV